ncbi:hypothetical protein CUJ84_Chr002301 [Rhizobium leguminosarum]|uniref:Uncharacterized protein n=2 Tax=Rhizobium TaxID=379 RepID=A0A2K9Z3A1_RHILE|nr:hypothetical protein CUJ84_Chr002301 [Rhizobium leguminosarum]
MEITRGSGMTIWMIDLAHQETPTDGKRYVVVSVPRDKLDLNLKPGHGSLVFSREE